MNAVFSFYAYYFNDSRAMGARRGSFTMAAKVSFIAGSAMMSVMAWRMAGSFIISAMAGRIWGELIILIMDWRFSGADMAFCIASGLLCIIDEGLAWPIILVSECGDWSA